MIRDEGLKRKLTEKATYHERLRRHHDDQQTVKAFWRAKRAYQTE